MNILVSVGILMSSLRAYMGGDPSTVVETRFPEKVVKRLRRPFSPLRGSDDVWSFCNMYNSESLLFPRFL